MPVFAIPSGLHSLFCRAANYYHFYTERSANRLGGVPNYACRLYTSGWGNVTSLAQLTADATHRLVTDAEKTGWNEKADVFTFNYEGYLNPQENGRKCRFTPADILPELSYNLTVQNGIHFI